MTWILRDWWCVCCFFFFFQAEDGIRDLTVTGVQTCALPICGDVRPGDVGAARAAASHRRALPLGAARHRRRVTRLHPFTLLALAAALVALAWLLPAPGGGLATVAAALGLAGSRGLRRRLWPALATAAPFWLFLFILHDVPT